MATYLPYGNQANTNISDSDRAKYFDQEKGPKDSTHWKLKDGYEVRALSKGEKPSKLNSLATYTNDFDDLHDEYDANSDRENFGIFKTYARPEDTDPEPTTKQTPETQAVKETPNGTAVDGSHLADAKDRVKAWDNKSNEAQTDHDTFGQGTQKKDYDFTNDKFLNSSNQAPEKANQLLNTYKNSVAGAFKPLG